MQARRTTSTDEAIQSIVSAPNILVLTGAGMSAESGIPTFRQAQTGLWSNFKPEELATPQAFEQNPARVWDWYCWRRQLVKKAVPHPGYSSLVRWQKMHGNLSIVTQNVDGLHQSAGSDGVIELHGNIMRSVCSKTFKPVDDDWLAQHPGSPVPSPHSSQAWVRPAVTWFGEALPEKALEEAHALATSAEVLLSVGTSSLVHPAASLPVIALENGARLFEINPESTPLSKAVDYHFRMTASEALEMIVDRLSPSAESFNSNR